MILLLTATWQFYRQQPLQAFLALLGIALGVAAISSMDSVHEQASLAHERGLSQLYGPSALEIVRTDGKGLDENIYSHLLTQNGSLPLVPWLQGEVNIQGQSLELVGIDPLAPASFDLLLSLNRLRPTETSSTSSNWPEFLALLNDPIAMVMAAATAESFGLAVGDQFEASVAGVVHRMKLVATWDAEGWADRWVITDIAQAQFWLQRVGYLDRILLYEQALTPQQRTFIDTQLNDLHEVRNVDQFQRVEQMSQAFYTNLKAMGLLAWLLGIFLAYNAYALINRQRWEEYSHWRILGVTPVQLILVLILDAAIMGLVGGLIGVLLGRYMAAVLLPLVTNIGSYFYGGAVAAKVVPATAWLKSLLGPLAAWAALTPVAIAVFRQRAIQLNHSVDTPPEQTKKVWTLALLGVVAILIGLLLRGRLASVSAEDVNVGFAVLFFLFIGYALLVPLLLSFLLKWFAVNERIAPALLRQHLSRQGVAQAAFVIALAAGLGIGVMIQSFRDSVVTWLDQILWADYYISAVSSDQSSPLDKQVLERLTAIPGVLKTGGVRASRRQSSEGAWFNVNAYALDDTRLHALPLFAGHVTNAHQRWQSGEGLFINESLAHQERVEVGELFQLQTPNGFIELPILGINADYSADEGALVMAWHHYAHHFKDDYFDAMGMVLADSLSIERVQAVINSGLDSSVDLRWIRQQGVYDRSLFVFDQTFSVTRAGRWLILFIALVAVAGAMTAMVLAQRPWLGTLRALGVTPRGLSFLILEQGFLLGVCAALLSIPLGLGVSWVLAQDIMRVSFGWLLPVRVQWGALTVVILQALLVALLASIYPAWRWRRENLRQSKMLG